MATNQNQTGLRSEERSSSVTISGIRYVVIRERAYEHKGQPRTALTLKRPAGQRTYFAVRYENGALSEAV